MNILNWINENNQLVSHQADGSEYGVFKVSDDKETIYLAFYHPPERLGGYLDHNLKVVAGFGAVCAKGPHPNTICQTVEEAQKRCQRHNDWEYC